MTNNGRIDLTLKTLKYIYIIELKKDSSASSAIEQIKKSNYIGKYKFVGLPLRILGISISTANRHIADWEEEKI